MIDDTDLQILGLLQENARIPNAEVARRVEMAPSAIHERIRKLEETGVISCYQPILDPHRFRAGLLAFVFVRADETPGMMTAGEQLAAIPEVLEVHHIAGEDCYLVKARVADTPSLGRLLREKFGAIQTVKSTRTTIVLDTMKETRNPPLRPAEEC